MIKDNSPGLESLGYYHFEIEKEDFSYENQSAI